MTSCIANKHFNQSLRRTTGSLTGPLSAGASFNSPRDTHTQKQSKPLRCYFPFKYPAKTTQVVSPTDRQNPASNLVALFWVFTCLAPVMLECRTVWSRQHWSVFSVTPIGREVANQGYVGGWRAV